MSSLLAITISDWIQVHKQPEFALMFARSHNTCARLQSFIGAAEGELPLWHPNANAIESWHNSLPNLLGLVMRTSFGRMLEKTIPAICRDASLMLAANGWPIQPAFIPLGMAEVALSRLEEGPPLLANKDRSEFKVLSRSYTRKYPVATLTRRRQKAYNRSLKGKFGEGISKEEVQDVAMSVHTIERDLRYKGPSNPGYRCNCKRFVHIGLCSCVLLSLIHI